MDPYMEHAIKHVNNFNQFAGQFTKIFLPLVDAATKMSANEPISAFEAFSVAKSLTNSKTKNKNKNNGATKNKPNKKVKGTGKAKGAAAPASVKNAAKLKTSNTSKQAKSAATKNKAASQLNKQTLNNGALKKLAKADKKEDSEESLAEQLNNYDEAELGSNSESSFTEGSENESMFSDSTSGEYVVNEGETYLETETQEEAGSSSNNDDNRSAEASITKANKKRKNYDLLENNAKSSFNLRNTETKKLKKSPDAKGTSRKSLPAVINEEAVAENSSKSRATLSAKEKASNITKINVKLRPLSPPENIVKLNSIEEGKRAFKWLLNPVTVEDFFAKFWEQKACLIKREQKNYFGHLISFEAIDQMLLQNHVEFTKNIDVTSYKNGVRETLNPEGRALPPVVWDQYGQGCSIRLLNPQTFLPALYTLSATMQEYFHCLVGANAYLTPPNSQGFAPHYDDIEAFVLQIEGRKRWKLYKPRHATETLPRFSSPNFSQDEIGEAVLEEVLKPGDVLYFPRGTIHQACTEPGYHSLHITLSVYQKQSYADLFEKMLPMMLEQAIAQNLDLRRGLPLYTFQHAGIVRSNQNSKERADLVEKVTQLMHDCIHKMPLEDIMDAGVDQLAKRFQREALPPEILPAEKLRTVFGSRSSTNESGECVCDYDINERTNVRLLRANILRLVYEEKEMRIYYYLDNSKEYCEYQPNFMEIEAGEAASVEVLIKCYPQYIGVSQLPLPTDERKINFVAALWERGLLMMEKPFR